MKIAVAYQNGEVFQHFGHTEHFKLYTITAEQIVAEKIVATQGSGHGALADFLKTHEVTTLICGGIGAGAQQALTTAGIEFYGGVTGSTDKAVNDFLQGQLIYDANAKCDHHDGDHVHKHEHQCK